MMTNGIRDIAGGMNPGLQKISGLSLVIAHDRYIGVSGLFIGHTFPRPVTETLSNEKRSVTSRAYRPMPLGPIQRSSISSFNTPCLFNQVADGHRLLENDVLDLIAQIFHN